MEVFLWLKRKTKKELHLDDLTKIYSLLTKGNKYVFRMKNESMRKDWMISNEVIK